MTNDFRSALLAEMHRAIDDAVADAFAMLELRGVEPTYPPGAELADAEISALANLSLSHEQRRAIEKIVRDVTSRPLFRLFSLIDGVADPEHWQGPWLGAHFALGHQDAHDEAMWHDDFYGSYWSYDRRRPPDV